MSCKYVFPLAVLLAVFRFAASSAAQQIPDPPTFTKTNQAKPMTPEEINHAKGLDVVIAIQQDRGLALDFSKGYRQVFPDQDITMAIIPVIDRVANRFVYAMEGPGKSKEAFLLELATIKGDTSSLKINISDHAAQNSIALQVKNGRISHANLETAKPSSSTEKAQAASSSLGSIWKFVDCLISNGIFNDSWYCTECGWWLITYAGSEGAFGADQVNLYCQLCANAIPNVFSFCWIYSNQ